MRRLAPPLPRATAQALQGRPARPFRRWSTACLPACLAAVLGAAPAWAQTRPGTGTTHTGTTHTGTIGTGNPSTVTGSIAAPPGSSTTITASSASTSSTITSSPAEPGTRVMVIEDESTRIEELHVRGEAQRVVVQSKRVNLPAWEIRPDSPGRGSAGETRLPRDTANTRMWRVWTF